VPPVGAPLVPNLRADQKVPSGARTLVPQDANTGPNRAIATYQLIAGKIIARFLSQKKTYIQYFDEKCIE